MPTVQLPIKNFPKQQEIFDHPANYKIVRKGRRFGLTRGAANDFMRSALEGKFKQGLWIDTVVSNIDRYVDRYFVPALKLLPNNPKTGQPLWLWRKQAKVLTIKDSYIDFRSVDRPENIEGFGYDKVFINEAGIVLRDEYLWHNAVQPMLFDFKDLDVVIGGTPKGRGVFYDLYMRGKSTDPENENWHSFHVTSFDNPKINQAELKREVDSAPERVRLQEYMGEFLDDSGIVFRNVDRIATARPQKPHKDHTYVIGVDLAKVQDYTVLAVYDRMTNQQVYQFRFRDLDFNLQKKRIRETAKHFNNALVIVDSTGLGEPVHDELIAEGVAVEGIHLTNESKKQLIEKMIMWIEQGKIRMLRINETMDEFKAFTYDVTKSGRIVYSAPPGLHDDIVIAHCLAVNSLYDILPKRRVKKKSPIKREFERQVALNKGEEELGIEYVDEYV